MKVDEAFGFKPFGQQQEAPQPFASILKLATLPLPRPHDVTVAERSCMLVSVSRLSCGTACSNASCHTLTQGPHRLQPLWHKRTAFVAKMSAAFQQKGIFRNAVQQTGTMPRAGSSNNSCPNLSKQAQAVQALRSGCIVAHKIILCLHFDSQHRLTK